MEIKNIDSVETEEEKLPQKAEEVQRDTPNPHRLRSVLFFVLMLVLAFCLGSFVRANVFSAVTIAQSSMEHTLSDGDTAYIAKLISPKQFSVVVIEDKSISEHWLIKRVIGVGGQEIEITDGILHVFQDGEETCYLEHYIADENISLPRTAVPVGELFLLGDNRCNSYDSQEFGCVSEDSVVGTVVFLKSCEAEILD